MQMQEGGCSASKLENGTPKNLEGKIKSRPAKNQSTGCAEPRRFAVVMQ